MRKRLCGKVISENETFLSTNFFSLSLVPYEPPMMKFMVEFVCIREFISLEKSSLENCFEFMSHKILKPFKETSFSNICSLSFSTMTEGFSREFCSLSSIIFKRQKADNLFEYSDCSSFENFSFKFPMQTIFIVIKTAPK